MKKLHYGAAQIEHADKDEPTLGRILMPIGGRVVGFAPGPGGSVHALVLAPVGAVVAPHPVKLMVLGQTYETILGQEVGEALGQIPGPEGPATFFQLLPWPTSPILRAN